MNNTKTSKPATVKQIVKTVEAEFAQGRHQIEANDLPFEIHFRTGCSWGRALSYANAIRVKAAR